MRKSRLSLFKSTSMLISVVGIIMIISTIIVVAYVGYSIVSSGITNEISSGTQYDELAELQNQYNNLSIKFDSIKATYYAGGADDVKVMFKVPWMPINRPMRLTVGLILLRKNLTLQSKHITIFNYFLFLFFLLGIYSRPTTYISELFLRDDAGFVVLTCLNLPLSESSISLYSGP